MPPWSISLRLLSWTPLLWLRFPCFIIHNFSLLCKQFLHEFSIFWYLLQSFFILFLPLPFLSAAFLYQTSFSSLHGNGISLFCLSLNICFCMLAVLYYVVRFYILIYHFSSRRKKYAMNYLSNLDCVDVVNFNFVNKI